MCEEQKGPVRTFDLRGKNQVGNLDVSGMLHMFELEFDGEPQGKMLLFILETHLIRVIGPGTVIDGHLHNFVANVGEQRDFGAERWKVLIGELEYAIQDLRTATWSKAVSLVTEQEAIASAGVPHAVRNVSGSAAILEISCPFGGSVTEHVARGNFFSVDTNPPEFSTK